MTRKWSPEKVLDEIRRFSTDGIAPPVRQNGEVYCLYRMACRYYGGWQPACKQAGVAPYWKREFGQPVVSPEEAERRLREDLRPYLRRRMALHAMALAWDRWHYIPAINGNGREVGR